MPNSKALLFASVLLLAGAVILVLLGSAAAPSYADVRLPSYREEKATSGARRVVCDDEEMQAAFAALELPEPPTFSGADPVPTRQIMNRVLEWKQSQSVDSVGELGLIFLALEEGRAAMKYLAAAHALDADDVWWGYFLAAACQKEGHADAAMRHLEAFIAEESSYATAYARLGTLYLDQGRLDQAEAAFSRCRESRPDQSPGYVGLGRVHLVREEHDRAVEVLQEAAATMSNDFMVQRFLGIALRATGEEKAAERATKLSERLPQYSGWLQFDPRLGRAHELAQSQRFLENQLRVASGRGDFAKAQAMVDRLIRRRPSDPDTRNTKATLFLQAKQMDAALKVLDEALRDHPENADLHFNRGRTLFLAGELGEALVALGRSLRYEPNNRATHDLRARTLYQLGRRPEGIEAMKHAVSLDRQNVESLLTLGVMYLETGQREEARNTFREVLRVDPSNQGARQQLKQLDAGGPR